ncbi:MAG: methyl-accepting chemotaxis protein [Saprospiraceae bacterium]|jgi:methyl-accepting chemotaxis protein
MEQELAQFRQILILTLVALILCILFIMVNVLGRMLVAPLSKLTEVADQISKGRLNKSIAFESNDGLGNLADSFRWMQASVKILARKTRAAGSPTTKVYDKQRDRLA